MPSKLCEKCVKNHRKKTKRVKEWASFCTSKLYKPEKKRIRNCETTWRPVIEALKH